MKDEHFLDELRSYHADLQVVVAFRMLPEVVWAMPRFGTFNVHAALLPDYRGAAPINWAVINGETLTGVTTFFLDHDIDTGRIIAQRQFPIPDDADVEYVYDALMQLGAQLCTHTVDLVLSTDGNAPSQPQQDSDAHHAAPKIFKETCAIDFSLPAKRIYDFVRGLSPAPGAWCLLTPRYANAKCLRSTRQQRPTSPQQGVHLSQVHQTIKQQGVHLSQVHQTIKQQGVHLSQVHQTIKQQTPTTNQPV